MELGKIRGISIKLHYSTLVIVALVGFSAAQFFYSFAGGTVTLNDLIFVGMTSGVILLLSILLHELMHSFAAQHYGLEIHEIEMYLFGGVSKLEGEPKRPKEEFVIAIVGPLTSLALGFGFILMYLFLPMISVVFDAILFYAGISNIVLGVFNLLPAYPMDGGRLVRAALWRKRGDIVSATKTAAKIGIFFGGLLIFIGIADVFITGTIGGIWLVVMGGFLRNAARNSVAATYVSNKMNDFFAEDLMSEPLTSIESNRSLKDAHELYFKRLKVPFIPVEEHDEITGVIFIEDLKGVNPEYLSSLIVKSLTRPIESITRVYSNESSKTVFNLLNNHEVNNKFVIAVLSRLTDKPVGFIGAKEIEYFLKYG